MAAVVTRVSWMVFLKELEKAVFPDFKCVLKLHGGPPHSVAWRCYFYLTKMKGSRRECFSIGDKAEARHYLCSQGQCLMKAGRAGLPCGLGGHNADQVFL